MLLKKCLLPVYRWTQTQLYTGDTAAGNAQYLWLVDVHSFDEYKALFDMMIEVSFRYDLLNSPSSNALQEGIDYLTAKGIYGGKTHIVLKINTPIKVVVADVLEGKILPSTYDGGWTVLEVDINRLEGKLLALYPVAPTAISIALPQTVTAGKEAVLSTSVLSASTILALHSRSP